MKSLQHHLRQYVAARRALGTRLREPAKTLSGFILFLGRKKSKFITIPLALEWSQQSKDVQRATWARKLSMVRQFARWLSVTEPRHQVPPPRLLNVRHRRNKPHIYSDQEIARLMAAAAALKSPRGMKGLTLGTLIGLLAATGLRPGEGGARGTPLDLSVVRSWFCKVSRSCGLRKGSEGKRYGRGPRLQDLRHTFATKRLIEWYRAGSNVPLQMPKLTTYLGHSSVACTYWYIEAVPELLELATEFQLAATGGRR